MKCASLLLYTELPSPLLLVDISLQKQLSVLPLLGTLSILLCKLGSSDIDDMT